ncbi:MAG: hypothetical protein EHM93_07945 [Bacteroidales bacterium]|nr:MAG: hypothetical protein EHM93_07945 [Bacteroidales bacterium]
MKKNPAFEVVLFLTFYSCTILKDVSLNPERFLINDDLRTDIYASASKGVIISPFSMDIENPEKLMLFDFKGHIKYKFLECQFYNDSVFGKGIVCMLMRHDDRLEIYHTKGLNMKQQLYYFDSVQHTIPTQLFNPTCSFENQNGNLKFNLSFTDKYGNNIVANLSGNYPESLDFIAPIGLINLHHSDYTFFPLWYMRKMNFLNTHEGNASIAINDTILTIKKIPGLINWQRLYFARWSFDPIFIIWNTNKSVPTEGIKKESNENDSITYIINQNHGYVEIKSILFKGVKHNSTIQFSPALPEFFCLKDSILLNGRFTIDVDEKKGVIGGKYSITKKGKSVEILVQPTKGWQPVPGRTWVKNHILTINLTETKSNKVIIASKWRLKLNTHRVL